MRSINNWRIGKKPNRREERLDEAFNRGGNRPKRPVTLPRVTIQSKEVGDDDEER